MTNFTFAAEISSFKGGVDPIDMASIDIELTRNTTMAELEAFDKQIPTYDDVVDELDRAPRDWSPFGWIITIDGVRIDFDPGYESIELEYLFQAILDTKYTVHDEKFKSLRAAVYPLAYDWNNHTPEYVTALDAKRNFQNEFESMMYDYQVSILEELAKKHDMKVRFVHLDYEYFYK